MQLVQEPQVLQVHEEAQGHKATQVALQVLQELVVQLAPQVTQVVLLVLQDLSVNKVLLVVQVLQGHMAQLV